MPWASTDAEKICDYLNYAWDNYSQAIGANVYTDYYNFSAKLSPAEYIASQPVPIRFTVAQIQTRLNGITSEYKITTVQKILATLDTIETQKDAAIGSQNYALVKADSLEWDIRYKQQGFDDRSFQLTERLRYHLNFPPTPQPNSGGNITRS